MQTFKYFFPNDIQYRTLLELEMDEKGKGHFFGHDYHLFK